MSSQGELLVAIINNLHDFTIARDEHWYHIPVTSVDKWLKNRWPPQWLAFYQTKVFGQEAYAIHYYAQILNIRRVRRWQLFPNQPRDKKSNRLYYQLSLRPLQRLPKPIVSLRFRRIVFVPTTLEKFVKATEINDLYDESPLEDSLWTEFKRLQISAERQLFVEVEKHNYSLDFAIYCAKGKINVETDGDVWHANPERAAQDNLRDNDLKTVGWNILRFNGYQIREETQEYCLPTIVKNINKLAGVDEENLIPRKIDSSAISGSCQLTFFQ